MFGRFLLRLYGYAPEPSCLPRYLINLGTRILARRIFGRKTDVLTYPINIAGYRWRSHIGIVLSGTGRELWHCLTPLEHEKIFLALLRRYLKKGSIFIDVGAHIGLFTVYASRLVGDEGKVIAIEPDPRVFPILLKNLTINSVNNVKALKIALSDRNGYVRLKLSYVSGWTSITDLHKDAVQQEITVPALTLDTLTRYLNLDRIDVVKIDVEGAEVQVLKGAEQTLHKHRPVLLVEVHGTENLEKLVKLLEKHGYTINILGKIRLRYMGYYCLGLSRR